MTPLDHRGRPLRTLEFLPGKKKLAVLYPGMYYTLKAPLFFYLMQLCEQEGWDVVGLDYRYHEDPEFGAASDVEKDRWFQADSLAVGRWVADKAAGYGRVAYVGKSLGTTMLVNQVEAGLTVPGADLVWLTPGGSAGRQFTLLPSLPNRSFVAYGTADNHALKAASTAPRNLPRVTLLEVADAGHNFEVVGDLGRSIDNLGRVVLAVGSFLGEAR